MYGSNPTYEMVGVYSINLRSLDFSPTGQPVFKLRTNADNKIYYFHMRENVHAFICLRFGVKWMFTDAEICHNL